MDLDFGAMNTPSSHQGTLEQLCNQQIISYNSPTLSSQANPSFQQSNRPETVTTMFANMAANIPASQLQGYTVFQRWSFYDS